MEFESFSRRNALGRLGALGGSLGFGSSFSEANASTQSGEAGHGSAFSKLSLYAGDFGVIGDGIADDTSAVQAFLDHCAREGSRIAHFGTMQVRISGPLRARNVGIVFEPVGIGVGPNGIEGALKAGFLAMPGKAGRYTALTVVGVVSDFQATVYGPRDSGLSVGDDGRILKDTRVDVDGIQFGDAGVESGALASSIITNARAHNLRGFGIKHINVYDTVILSETVEWCGNDRDYAWSVEGSERDGMGTCNETHWLRVQVERSVARAMYVSGLTLSCRFSKIHSERGFARPVPTAYADGQHMWSFGGNCIFDCVRLHAVNPATARLGGEGAVYSLLRAERGVSCYCAGENGQGITLIEPAAKLMSVPRQFGHLTVVGGEVDAIDLGPGWSFFNARIGTMTIGSGEQAEAVTVYSSSIGSLAPTSPFARATLSGCQVAKQTLSGREGAFAHLRLIDTIVDAGNVTVKGVMVSLSGSEMRGQFALEDSAILLSNGSKIDGDVTIVRAPQLVCDGSSFITGRLVGMDYPRSAARFAHHAGMQARNPKPAKGQPLGWICVESSVGAKAGRWAPTMIWGG